MTPEQREEIKAAALAADQGGQHIYTNPRDSNNWSNNETWHAAASPALILSLIAQVEALTLRTERAERALVRGGFVDNGAQEWKPPLGPAPKFIEVEALTVPQIVAFGCTLIGHASTTDGMDDKEATAWVSQQWEEWSSPTIPAIQGTKEGA